MALHRPNPLVGSAPVRRAFVRRRSCGLRSRIWSWSRWATPLPPGWIYEVLA